MPCPLLPFDPAKKCVSFFRFMVFSRKEHSFIIFFCKKRNIVATVNLDCRLDLKTIALHARNAEYNPVRIFRPSTHMALSILVPLFALWERVERLVGCGTVFG